MPTANDPNTTDEIPKDNKLVIYQLLPRLFGNKVALNKTYGTIAENGCGKFDDINNLALNKLRELGATHVWYTGVLEHATMTAYPQAGLPADDADVVKGRAGSPYAIKDYYDVDPDLAVDNKNRLAEFEALVKRTHDHGLESRSWTSFPTTWRARTTPMPSQRAWWTWARTTTKLEDLRAK
ncbi:MAG: hypothetical protein WKG07_28800 [Hymenobacter sp.]